MKIIADLHIHSKYSRATSSSMDLESLVKWAKIKGLNLLSTGDFTHPLWLAYLKENLIEFSPGIYQFKANPADVYFVLGTEISLIYSQKGKTRRIHNLIFAPSFKIVEKINQALSLRGANLSSDGRPIIGLSSIQLCEILFEISPEIFIVPAHIWTPWFSLYGANSGFDSLQACFGEYSPLIKAIETGLSSNPQMNWRIRELDERAIISGSDAHSPSKLGREATVFELTRLNYQNLVRAMSQRNSGQLLYTIEFFPEEGKYHYTGHRNCGVVLSPQETQEKGYLCPHCGRPLTVGVMQRVEDLADPKRPENFVPPNTPSYQSTVPLEEIIASVLNQKKGSLKVQALYNRFISQFRNELNVLIDQSIEDLKQVDQEIALAIEKVRQGQVNVSPGYDGLFGQVSIPIDEPTSFYQESLFPF